LVEGIVFVGAHHRHRRHAALADLHPNSVLAHGWELTARSNLSNSRAPAASSTREYATAAVEAEAIVVGGSGGGLAGSLSLGSLVDDLLHFAPVPVAVAPRGTRDSDVERVRTVTCAIGYRPGARRLLGTALRASRATGAPLRLVSLVALDQHGEHGVAAASGHAFATLESAKAALAEGSDVTAVVADGATIEAAVEGLDWEEGDLLMLGSGRLAPPRRLFIGSTAARILRVLEVPIVVTPGEDE
jgi:nucleotide-binding universal stress UspA family protein